MKNILPTAIVTTLCFGLGIPSADAEEGLNWLDNGDFEWPLDCDFWDGVTADQATDGPVIHTTGGNPCSFVRLESFENETSTMLARQVVDVEAALNDWIVLKFEAETDTAFDYRAAVDLMINTEPADYRGLPDGVVWADGTWIVRKQITDQDDVDPEVTVRLRICTPVAEEGTFDVDNVSITVVSNPPAESTFGVPTCADDPVDDIAVGGFDPCCPEDCDVAADATRPNGSVDFDDILAVLDDWGQASSCTRANVDGDGDVDADDLQMVIDAFGAPCGGTVDPDDWQGELDCMDIDEDCWDDMFDTLENGTAAAQADVICWILHYESCHCPDTCVSGPSGCGSDPCGIH